jgi:phosphatidyl-myo-inositol dimannoside synthase
MHICFLTRNFDAAYLGGRNPSLRVIAPELVRRGHVVSIVSSPYRSSTSGESWSANVHFSRMLFGHYQLSLPFVGAGLLPVLHRVNRGRSIDVIHGCEREFSGPAGILFSRFYRIPFVQWAYDLGFISQKKDIMNTRPKAMWLPLFAYMRAMEHLVLSGAAAITTIGEDISASLVSRGYTSAKVRLIGNTVDSSVFSPRRHSVSLAKELGVHGRRVVSYVTRINKLRGVDVFVRACALIERELPGTVFLVVGSDKDGYRKECERMAASAGGADIRWLPPRDDVPEIFRLSDCVAISVRSEAGGVGNTLLEAMSCGRPVVQSSVAGAPYVIRDGENGFLFPDGDHVALSNKVCRVLSEPDLAQKAGSLARQTVLDEFSVGATADRLEALYQSLACPVAS